MLLELHHKSPLQLSKPFRFQSVWLHHPTFPLGVKKVLHVGNPFGFCDIGLYYSFEEVEG